MNIFFLDIHIRKAVSYYYNRHCIKIILEICQMLYTAHWCTNSDKWIDKHNGDTQTTPYKKTHANHPTSRWVRQHYNNYIYTCAMGLELCYEYTRRYHKVHKSQSRLEWLIDNHPSQFDLTPIPAFLSSINIPPGCTPVPLAMPSEYHTPDLLKSYRLYYLSAKKDISHSDTHFAHLQKVWQM